ncbi:hypothetical protein [Desulfurococcus sp.]|uniref:hypothetical protein n=2 Tax=Desulfurococcus sp. TaxID=51678 RepID=UPI003175CB33
MRLVEMSTPSTQLSEIVDILAFLGAVGDYGYIDRLGNAIDEVTFMEAVRDSIRAYYTNCLGEKKCVEYDREKKAGVLCPDLKPGQLEKIISSILDTISKASRVDVIKLSRKIALEAYAKIPGVRESQGCKTE